MSRVGITSTTFGVWNRFTTEGDYCVATSLRGPLNIYLLLPERTWCPWATAGSYLLNRHIITRRLTATQWGPVLSRPGPCPTPCGDLFHLRIIWREPPTSRCGWGISLGSPKKSHYLLRPVKLAPNCTFKWSICHQKARGAISTVARKQLWPT